MLLGREYLIGTRGEVKVGTLDRDIMLSGRCYGQVKLIKSSSVVSIGLRPYHVECTFSLNNVGPVVINLLNR